MNPEINSIRHSWVCDRSGRAIRRVHSPKDEYLAPKNYDMIYPQSAPHQIEFLTESEALRKMKN